MWRQPSTGHVIDRLAWGPLDLDKVVNDLKTLGVKFQSDTNPRGYPACNFVGGNADEGSIRRLQGSLNSGTVDRVAG